MINICILIIRPEIYILFTSKVRLISGGNVERQFYPDVYISSARTAVRSPSISPLSLSSALERLS